MDRVIQLPKLVAELPDSARTAISLTKAGIAHPTLRFENEVPTHFRAHVFSSRVIAHVRSFYVLAKSSTEAERLIAYAFPDMDTIAIEVIDYMPSGRVVQRNNVALMQEVLR